METKRGGALMEKMTKKEMIAFLKGMDKRKEYLENKKSRLKGSVETLEEAIQRNTFSKPDDDAGVVSGTFSPDKVFRVLLNSQRDIEEETKSMVYRMRDIYTAEDQIDFVRYCLLQLQKLLLIREGCNYAFCAADVQMSSEAGALAEILMGWTGIPALVSILKHSLLLGWAYAESLLDVRELMEGGRIPLKGTKETWLLSIDQLVNINELLEHGRGSRKEGLDYHGYLRLLMYLQGCNAQKKRGLELIELRVRSQTGLSNFQADHLVVAVHDQTEWHIPPLFSSVTGVFMGLMSGEGEILVDGGFSYLQQ